MSSLRTFRQDLAAGGAIEDRVARWLRQAYRVNLATREEQRLGFDLVLRLLLGRLRIEVKSQQGAGHAMFLEVRGGGLAEEGWAFTSQCDLFAFADEAARFVLLVPPGRLRVELGRWVAEYGQATSPARDGSRRRPTGVLVPWWQLDRAGLGVWWLDGPPPAEQVLAGCLPAAAARQVLDLGKADPPPEPFDPWKHNSLQLEGPAAG